jgi:hypothetical protein
LCCQFIELAPILVIRYAQVLSLLSTLVEVLDRKNARACYVPLQLAWMSIAIIALVH